MTIKTACPACGRPFELSDATSGKKARCKNCDAKFRVRSGASELIERGNVAPQSSSASPATSPDEASVPVIWHKGDVILDQYDVLELLGAGGMGQVYRVHSRALDLDLAVKSPLPEILSTPGAVENFERECETWVDLGLHPHIVSCYYVQRLGGIPRVFAEFVEGGSLQDWIGTKKLYVGGPNQALHRILDFAIQFAWGLHYAHKRGLVHRDIKPANVLVMADDSVLAVSDGTVKVTDFGIAKAREVSGLDNPTDQSQSILVSGAGGTPAYWSPEQAEADAQAKAGVPREQRTQASRCVDVWGWATSVLEMFVAEPAWGRGQMAGCWLEHTYPEFPIESDLPRIPPGVLVLLQECLRTEPAERPTTLDVVATRLLALYAEITGSVYPREEPQAAELQADSLNNRAVSLWVLGKNEAAERAWEQALQVNPHHLESTFNWGLQKCRCGRMDSMKLLMDLREVVLLHPGEWLPQYKLAQIYVEHGDLEDAIETLSTLPASDREQPAVKQLLAWVIEHQATIKSPRCLRTFEGHADDVNTVCLSIDGRYALSGSWDNTLKLWEVSTGRCLRTFEGHSASVNSVCISVDGRYALSGSGDRTLKLWDVSTGYCLRTFGEHTRLQRLQRLWGFLAKGMLTRTSLGHSFSVDSVCLSGDGRYALSRGQNSLLKSWDVSTGACLRTFGGDTLHWLCSILFSILLGAIIIVLAAPVTIPMLMVLLMAWMADLISNFRRPAPRVTRRTLVHPVSLGVDGRLALSARWDGTLKLWDTSTGGSVRTFEKSHKVSSVSLSVDGCYALSGSEDKTVKLWNVSTGHCCRTFNGHNDAVNSVCLSFDGRFALSGSVDKTLKFWNVNTGRRLREFKGHTSAVNSVCLSVNGRYALSASNDKTLKLWDVGWNSPKMTMAYSNIVNADVARRVALELEQSINDSQVAAANGDSSLALDLLRRARGLLGCHRQTKAINLWSEFYHRVPRRRFCGGWLQASFDGHTKPVTSVRLCADGQYALSGSEDETLKLWEVPTGRCLRTFKWNGTTVRSVCLNVDGEYALSCSGSKLKLWKVSTGEQLRTFWGHTDWIRSVCLSVDARYALSGGDDGTLKLWEVSSGRCLRTFDGHNGYVSSVCLSGDGRFALSGSHDSTLKLWDVSIGRCLRTSNGHSGWVQSVCLTSDGRFALSGGLDSTLKLWNVNTGRCLRTFGGDVDLLESVCLSGGGRYALSGGGKKMKLWDVSTGLCLRTFEGHTGDVTSVCLACDCRYALSGSVDKTVKLWFLDWELESRQPADWDDGARRHLEVFLASHVPYAATLPTDRTPSDEEISRALTRQGHPEWTEPDFNQLLHTLGCAGYGWLRAEGVRCKLEEMASNWTGPPPLIGGT